MNEGNIIEINNESKEFGEFNTLFNDLEGKLIDMTGKLIDNTSRITNIDFLLDKVKTEVRPAELNKESGINANLEGDCIYGKVENTISYLEDLILLIDRQSKDLKDITIRLEAL